MKFNMKIAGVICISFVLSVAVFAQSGRVIETATPTPEVSAPAPAAVKYPPCEKGLDETIYLSPREIKGLIDELNRLGNCGYRMEAAGRIPFGMRVFAVTKLDPGNKYEYQWFAAFSGGEVVTLANSAAKDGFYFRRGMMFFSSNDRHTTEEGQVSINANLGLDNFPGNGSLYIFERKNGEVKRREYRMLNGADARGEKAIAFNQRVLDDKIALGFRPVGIYYTGAFDVFQILAEKDDDIKPEGEYLIFRYAYDSARLFTERALQGYKPLMVGFYFALLHRENSEPVPLRYESTDHFPQIIKKLPKLKGARYVTKGLDNYYMDIDLIDNKPFFSVPLTNSLKSYEYVFLQMSDYRDRYYKKKDKTASLTDPPTAEMTKKFQDLLRKGFIIRDVYFYKEVTVIFEREQKVAKSVY